MDGLGTLLEALAKTFQLLRQLGVLCLQPPERERLSHTQTDQATQHRASQRLSDQSPQHQPDQHEDPLHAVRSRSDKSLRIQAMPAGAV
ncbi:hypothetical protein D3C84_312920 [compost metagenome]